MSTVISENCFPGRVSPSKISEFPWCQSTGMQGTEWPAEYILMLAMVNVLSALRGFKCCVCHMAQQWGWEARGRQAPKGEDPAQDMQRSPANIWCHGTPMGQPPNGTATPALSP